MNKQEYQSEIIQAKQEALEWQGKYIVQCEINAKQTEKIMRQTARIAELEALYKGAQSKKNERRVENLANELSRMLEIQLANFAHMKESADDLIDQFRKG